MTQIFSPQRFIAGVGVLIAALFFVPLLWPETAAPHFREDSTIEMGGAILFLLGGVLCIFAAVHHRTARYWYTLIASWGILCGLDEISYGERIIGYEPLEISRVKVDALHDLPRVWKGKLADGTDYPYLVLLVLFALIAWGVVSFLLWRARSGHERWALPQAMSLFVASVLCVLGGQLLDFLPHGIALFEASFIEETLEAAGGLFVTALALLSHGPARSRSSLPHAAE